MAFKDRMKDAAQKSAEFAKERRAERQESTAAQAALDAQSAAQIAQVAHPAVPDADSSQVLLEVKSHDAGRNAVVRIYSDRVERHQSRARTSISGARQDAEVIPIRSISSVQARKDGLMYTKVIVYATGNTIEFRLAHADAQLMKDQITRRLLAPSASASPPAPGPGPSFADQLRELAKLRDDGLLTEAEFAAQKTKLMG